MPGRRQRRRPRRRFATPPRSCSISTPGELRAKANRSLPTSSIYAPSRRSSPSTKRRIRHKPSSKSSPISAAPGRWIASSAATSVSARRRSHCAQLSSPCRRASKWPCSCRPPFSRNSTTKASPIVSPTGPCASSRYRAFAARKRSTKSSPVSNRDRSTSSSVRTGCCRLA